MIKYNLYENDAIFIKKDAWTYEIVNSTAIWSKKVDIDCIYALSSRYYVKAIVTVSSPARYVISTKPIK